jgi:PAS domain S-box-containing protein
METEAKTSAVRGIRDLPRSLDDRIGRRLAIFAVSIACLIWASAWWMVARDRSETVATAVKDTQNVAHAFEAHVDSLVGRLDQILQFVRLQYLAQGRDFDLPRSLGQIHVPDAVLQVWIRDAHGRPLHSSQRSPWLDLSDQKYYLSQRDNGAGGLFIGKPMLERISGRFIVPFSRRIVRADGSFGGVVALSLDPVYLAAFYNELDLGKGSVVDVIGTDGIVRARREGEAFSVDRDIQGARLFEESARASSGSYLAEGPFDGRRRYVSYRSLRDYPLIVLVGRLEAEALARFHARRRYILAMAATCTLLVMGCALWLMILFSRQSRHAAELLDSHARLRAFMDSVPDFGWMKDSRGRFVAANRAHADRFGMAPPDMIGKTDFDVFGETLALKHQRAENEILATGRMLQYEASVEHKGEACWLEIIKAPVYDAKGALWGTCGVARDITKRKEAEAAVHEMNRALEQKAEELAEVNRELEAFSYTVSHDLRAPVRHIAGFTKLVGDKLAEYPDPYVQRLLEKIENAAARMGMMINGLLTLSRSGRSKLHLGPVALDRLIGEIIDELMPLPSGREIRWRVGSLPLVSGDRNLLQLAFANLVGNAVKYTRNEPVAVIEITSSRNVGDEFVVSICDNGVGFDMKDAERIFNVFERAHDDRAFGGTGVGLATVKRVIERHGGRVWAAGRPGAGAVFHVVLRSYDESGRSAERPDPADAPEAA